MQHEHELSIGEQHGRSRMTRAHIKGNEELLIDLN
jgi:hypothetical protein